MRPSGHEVTALKQLFQKQLAYVQDNPALLADPRRAEYLQHKFELDITLERQIRVVDMFADQIRGKVLEWGCHHGFDSCLLRMRLGHTAELFGCDIVPAQVLKAFQDLSGMQYKYLDHSYRLDYPPDFFDVVTSNGVLEHVPNDLELLKEIFRILKPGGTFVLTCLPNRYSYTEAIQRRRGPWAHDRLYSMVQAKKMLGAQGFRVVRTAYFFMLPTSLYGIPKGVQHAYQSVMGPVFWTVNDSLEWLWPVNRLASNLILIADKPQS